MQTSKSNKTLFKKLKVKQQNKVDKKKFIGIYLFGFVVLSALSILTNFKSLTWVNAGVQLISILVLLSSLALYEYVCDTKVLELTRNSLVTIFTVIVSYALIKVATNVTINGAQVGLQLVPFGLCALVLSLLVSDKCGFFANVNVVLIYYIEAINFDSGAILSRELSFYLIFGGLTEAVFASFVLGKHYARSRYLAFGAMLGLLSALCATVSYAIFVDIASWSLADLSIKLLCTFASGILGVMFMFVLVPLFETIFDVTSVFRFSEIATSDNQLMRKLFEKAPGTYNHSLTVAIYAEACAVAIGENATLARAASYYHDIGKIKNPSYFAENQLTGKNPHDNMTAEASVSVIRSHPLNGLAIAKEYGLPQEVQRAIIEHHGTTVIKYFYLKAQKYTDGTLPTDDFCYKGPKPTNKISAILMICDACEAALRANGNKDNAEKIIDDIVKERLEFEQFSDCDISLKEIDTIKSTIFTTFSGIKHDRIVYPDVMLEDDQQRTESTVE